jgi:hypothetical protein
MPHAGVARTIGNIKSDGQKLIEAIGKLSKSQKELWQKLPYLALEADGHNGYSPDLADIYRNGIWPVKSSIVTHSWSYVCVDCATGELISGNAFRAHGTIEPPDGGAVLRILSHLEELNAQHVIDDLVRYGTQRTWGDQGTEEEQDEWRESVRKDLKLGELFVRHSK